MNEKLNSLSEEKFKKLQQFMNVVLLSRGRCGKSTSILCRPPTDLADVNQSFSHKRVHPHVLPEKHNVMPSYNNALSLSLHRRTKSPVIVPEERFLPFTELFRSILPSLIVFFLLHDFVLSSFFVTSPSGGLTTHTESFPFVFTAEKNRAWSKIKPC